MQVLILGYHGFSNTGDDALLWAVMRGIAAQLAPGARFVLVGERSAFSVPPELEGSCTFLPSHRGIMLVALRMCDRVVYAGGGIFQDYGVVGTRGVRTILVTTLVAGLLRKPVFFLFVGVGDLTTPIGKALSSASIRLARATIFRDGESPRRLSRRSVDRSYVGADASALLEVRRSVRAVPARRRILAVSAFPYFKHVAGTDAGDERISALIVSAVRGAWGRGFDELRFVVMHGGGRSEAPYLSALRDRLGDLPSTLVQYDKDPTLAMARIRECSGLIAMRLHALMFAYLSDIPVIAVAYHDKVRTLMADVGLSGDVLELSATPDEAFAKGRAMPSKASPVVSPEEYAARVDSAWAWLRTKW